LGKKVRGEGKKMDMTGAAQDIQELVHAFAQVSLVVVLSPFHPRKKKASNPHFLFAQFLHVCMQLSSTTNKFFSFLACFPIIVTINNSFLVSVHGFFCF
jgi:hypothetical protein